MTTLAQMAQHHKAVDKALAQLGSNLPKQARMWAVCRERRAKYRYPCNARAGLKYTSPDDCPFIDSCTPDMADNAVVAFIEKLAGVMPSDDRSSRDG